MTPKTQLMPAREEEGNFLKQYKKGGKRKTSILIECKLIYTLFLLYLFMFEILFY